MGFILILTFYILHSSQVLTKFAYLLSLLTKSYIGLIVIVAAFPAAVELIGAEYLKVI